MPTGLIDTGFFLLTTGFAFLFFLMSLKFIGAHAQGVFNLMGFVIFMALALFLVSDYQVGTITETTITEDYEALNSADVVVTLNSTRTTTETELFIDNFTTQSIIGYVFFILGIVNAGLAFFLWFPQGRDSI